MAYQPLPKWEPFNQEVKEPVSVPKSGNSVFQYKRALEQKKTVMWKSTAKRESKLAEKLSNRWHDSGLPAYKKKVWIDQQELRVSDKTDVNKFVKSRKDKKKFANKQEIKDGEKVRSLFNKQDGKDTPNKDILKEKDDDQVMEDCEGQAANEGQDLDKVLTQFEQGQLDLEEERRKQLDEQLSLDQHCNLDGKGLEEKMKDDLEQMKVSRLDDKRAKKVLEAHLSQALSSCTLGTKRVQVRTELERNQSMKLEVIKQYHLGVKEKIKPRKKAKGLWATSKQYEQNLDGLKQAMQQLIAENKFTLVGADNTGLDVVSERLFLQDVLKAHQVKRPENTLLLKYIFGTVTLLQHEYDTMILAKRGKGYKGRHVRCVMDLQVAKSDDSLGRAQSKELLMLILNAYKERQTVSRVIDAEKLTEGAVNSFFYNLTTGMDKDGNMKVTKVDAILDARNCNEYVKLNKKALDYMRFNMPFLKSMQDMSYMVLHAQMHGHDQYAKVDMLNAYCQIPLPERLKAYTMFRIGDDFYQYEVLPFGLSISTHVFTTYLCIHLEIARAQYLKGLIPQCVKPAKWQASEYHLDRLDMRPVSSVEDVRKRFRNTSTRRKVYLYQGTTNKESVLEKRILGKEFAMKPNRLQEGAPPRNLNAIGKLHLWLAKLFREQDLLLSEMRYVGRQHLKKYWWYQRENGRKPFQTGRHNKEQSANKGWRNLLNKERVLDRALRQDLQVGYVRENKQKTLWVGLRKRKGKLVRKLNTVVAKKFHYLKKVEEHTKYVKLTSLVNIAIQVDDVLVSTNRNLFPGLRRHLLRYLYTQAELWTNVTKNHLVLGERQNTNTVRRDDLVKHRDELLTKLTPNLEGAVWRDEKSNDEVQKEHEMARASNLTVEFNGYKIGQDKQMGAVIVQVQDVHYNKLNKMVAELQKTKSLEIYGSIVDYLNWTQKYMWSVRIPVQTCRIYYYQIMDGIANKLKDSSDEEEQSKLMEELKVHQVAVDHLSGLVKQLLNYGYSWHVLYKSEGRKHYEINLEYGDTYQIGSTMLKLDSQRQLIKWIMPKGYWNVIKAMQKKVRGFDMNSCLRCQNDTEALAYELGHLPLDLQWQHWYARCIELCLLLERNSDLTIYLPVRTVHQKAMNAVVAVLKNMFEDIAAERKQRVLLVPLKRTNTLTVVENYLNLVEQVESRQLQLVWNSELVREAYSKQALLAEEDRDWVFKRTVVNRLEDAEIKRMGSCGAFLSTREFAEHYYLFQLRMKKDEMIFRRFYDKSQLAYVGNVAIIVTDEGQEKDFSAKGYRLICRERIKAILEAVKKQEQGLSQTSSVEERQFSTLAEMALEKKRNQVQAEGVLLYQEKVQATIVALEMVVVGAQNTENLALDVQVDLARLVIRVMGFLVESSRAVIAIANLLSVLEARQDLMKAELAKCQDYQQAQATLMKVNSALLVKTCLWVLQGHLSRYHELVLSMTCIGMEIDWVRKLILNETQFVRANYLAENQIGLMKMTLKQRMALRLSKKFNDKVCEDKKRSLDEGDYGWIDRSRVQYIMLGKTNVAVIPQVKEKEKAVIATWKKVQFRLEMNEKYLKKHCTLLDREEYKILEEKDIEVTDDDEESAEEAPKTFMNRQKMLDFFKLKEFRERRKVWKRIGQKERINYLLKSANEGDQEKGEQMSQWVMNSLDDFMRNESYNQNLVLLQQELLSAQVNEIKQRLLERQMMLSQVVERDQLTKQCSQEELVLVSLEEFVDYVPYMQGQWQELLELVQTDAQSMVSGKQGANAFVYDCSEDPLVVERKLKEVELQFQQTFKQGNQFYEEEKGSVEPYIREPEQMASRTQKQSDNQKELIDTSTPEGRQKEGRFLQQYQTTGSQQSQRSFQNKSFVRFNDSMLESAKPLLQRDFTGFDLFDEQLLTMNVDEGSRTPTPTWNSQVSETLQYYSSNMKKRECCLLQKQKMLDELEVLGESQLQNIEKGRLAVKDLMNPFQMSKRQVLAIQPIRDFQQKIPIMTQVAIANRVRNQEMSVEGSKAAVIDLLSQEQETKDLEEEEQEVDYQPLEEHRAVSEDQKLELYQQELMRTKEMGEELEQYDEIAQDEFAVTIRDNQRRKEVVKRLIHNNKQMKYLQEYIEIGDSDVIEGDLIYIQADDKDLNPSWQDDSIQIIESEKGTARTNVPKGLLKQINSLVMGFEEQKETFRKLGKRRYQDRISSGTQDQRNSSKGEKGQQQYQQQQQRGQITNKEIQKLQITYEQMGAVIADLKDWEKGADVKELKSMAINQTLKTSKGEYKEQVRKLQNGYEQRLQQVIDWSRYNALKHGHLKASELPRKTVIKYVVYSTSSENPDEEFRRRRLRIGARVRLSQEVMTYHKITKNFVDIRQVSVRELFWSFIHKCKRPEIKDKIDTKEGIELINLSWLILKKMRQGRMSEMVEADELNVNSFKMVEKTRSQEELRREYIRRKVRRLYVANFIKEYGSIHSQTGARMWDQYRRVKLIELLMYVKEVSSWMFEGKVNDVCSLERFRKFEDKDIVNIDTLMEVVSVEHLGRVLETIRTRETEKRALKARREEYEKRKRENIVLEPEVKKVPQQRVKRIKGIQILHSRAKFIILLEWTELSKRLEWDEVIRMMQRLGWQSFAELNILIEIAVLIAIRGFELQNRKGNAVNKVQLDSLVQISDKKLQEYRHEVKEEYSTGARLKGKGRSTWYLQELGWFKKECHYTNNYDKFVVLLHQVASWVSQKKKWKDLVQEGKVEVTQEENDEQFFTECDYTYVGEADAESPKVSDDEQKQVSDDEGAYTLSQSKPVEAVSQDTTKKKKKKKEKKVVSKGLESQELNRGLPPTQFARGKGVTIGKEQYAQSVTAIVRRLRDAHQSYQNYDEFCTPVKERFSTKKGGDAHLGIGSREVLDQAEFMTKF